MPGMGKRRGEREKHTGSTAVGTVFGFNGYLSLPVTNICCPTYFLKGWTTRQTTSTTMSITMKIQSLMWYLNNGHSLRSNECRGSIGSMLLLIIVFVFMTISLKLPISQIHNFHYNAITLEESRNVQVCAFATLHTDKTKRLRTIFLTRMCMSSCIVE